MTKSRVCQVCRKVVSGDCCRTQVKQATSGDGYDRKWQRFRKRLMQERAKAGKLICGICRKPFGATSPHADHIVPVESQDDPLFFNESNIQFLHPVCHGEKTQKDVKSGLTR